MNKKPNLFNQVIINSIEDYKNKIETLNKQKERLIRRDKKHREEIERLNKENEELKKIQCTFLGTGCKVEIERLTELCNKYEEEHKTTFETWQKDIKENELLHSIIKEVRELREQLSYQYYENGFEYDTPMLLKDLDKILDKENKW